LKIPNFFIIGAPKSGTTALSEYLREHPNIFMTTPKEPFYFDFDVKRARMSQKTYLELFSTADPNVHSAVGEASTGYLFSKVAVSEILKFNPAAKFIVVLRNPVDLVQALHSQMVFQGTENLSDFGDAWEAMDERLKGNKLPLFCLNKSGLIYSEAGKLGEQMERVLKVTGNEKIKIILFEDFVSDTKRVYEDVLKHLEVESDNRKEFPIVNESQNLIIPFIQPFLSLGVKSSRVMRSVFGFPKNSEMFIKLLFLNSRKGKRKIIKDELRLKIINYYREDVVKLSKLINRDLNHWMKV
jgi:hypothetical protein